MAQKHLSINLDVHTEPRYGEIKMQMQNMSTMKSV